MSRAAVVDRTLPVADGGNLQMIELTGAAPGPVLAVLGGVHGDEFEGVVAARVFAHRAAARLRRGQIRLVPVANPAAFAARRRTTPDDGANLARVFPGSATGTLTERVAAVLCARVLAGADLLVDLHSAGTGYRMPLFAGYVAGAPTGQRSAQAARAFGAPLLWRHPAANPGRSITAAADLGVPAIYVEGGGAGALTGHDVDAYLAGLDRLLDWLDMTGTPARAVQPPVLVDGGDGDVDASVAASVDGWCLTRVSAGDQVATGQTLAEILDDTGAVAQTVRSPRAGSVMMLRHRADIRAGDGVAMLGPVYR